MNLQKIKEDLEESEKKDKEMDLQKIKEDYEERIKKEEEEGYTRKGNALYRIESLACALDHYTLGVYQTIKVNDEKLEDMKEILKDEITDVKKDSFVIISLGYTFLFERYL